ncbi:sigma-70 family RNA polymerase sigma factor [Kitasatospora sp. GP82]|uniref:sigma-70 family RNA polymerase sigma factor n=1 Tax=Kitasatospora sp. GP82 TaxID=3035089 RepID=UPI002474F747|nr:sigma-70 family RNA polymerase sigma factor [Kitasatospora sp. GP82]MDH6129906.1 RNA polymerase sigma factor (sigma-70 family) [Kitasatospora sp. GP82]
MDRDCGAATVVQAQAGDRHATDELIGSHLPLVYNIVGRALSGHPDTDDVVQETMLRAVDGLPSLREPASFRSWLVAIAMNQIRHRHQAAQTQQAHTTVPGVGGYGSGTYGVGAHSPGGGEPADPGADFVNLTIVRLGLSGQRREVAEATRWLDDDDRELLALWWQEAAGELSRAELAGALGLSPQHTAVRVQRMKTQLETARVVVRALTTTPGCPQLAEVTASWDGAPAALWRKRIARHARDCMLCAQHQDGLVPAEGLLAGLALVPVPHGHPALPAAFSARFSAGHPAAGHPSAGRPAADWSAPAQSAGSPITTAERPATPVSHRAGQHAGRRHRVQPKRRRLLLTALGTAAVTVAAIGVVAAEQEQQPAAPTPQADALAAPASALTTPVIAPALPSTADPSASASASSAPSPTASATPSPAASTAAPSPTRTATPRPASPSASRSSTTARSAPAPTSISQQVIDLVNTERATAGCAPVRDNAKLRAAAQGQSDDMAARNFFDHTNPDGAGPQARIEAAGYRWSTWGENIARGQSDAAAVMDTWMHSPGHRANILNCAFTELGVGVHQGSGGPWWTQDFGAPS